MEIIYLIGLLMLPAFIGLGFALHHIFFKPKIASKLSTIQFGEKSKLIRISTIILSSPQSNIKTKGLFIYATNFLHGEFRQISETIQLTEQEIQETIDDLNSGLPIYVTWGKNPEVTFSINRNRTASISRTKYGILGKLNLNIIGTYFTFIAKINSSTLNQMNEAFINIQNSEVSAAHEM